MKIQNDDKVKVCKGADKGKQGKVLRILREDNRVVISSVNIRTIHKKPQTGEEKGSIEKKEMPINLSNIMFIDPESKKQTRVGYTGTGKEKKRITKKSGAVLKRSTRKKKKETGETKEAKQTTEKNKET